MNLNRILHKCALALIVAISSSAMAESLYLEDFNFSVNNSQGAEILSARWGVWNGSAFIQDIISEKNAGYVDLLDIETGTTLNQIDNSVYTQGTQMALAIFTDGSPDAQSLNWNSAVYGVVLVDSSWIAPAFNNNATPVTFNFSAATTAVLGTFAYNGGNESISLIPVSAIPEPATFAVLFGAAVLGLSGCRRRRQAC